VSCRAPLAELRAPGRLYAELTDVALTAARQEVLARVG
jgi:hypothetical protein